MEGHDEGGEVERREVAPLTPAAGMVFTEFFLSLETM